MTTQTNDPARCVHCGAKLDVRYHVNPWLQPWPAYECQLMHGMPLCPEGQQWYEKHLVRVPAGWEPKKEAES